MLKEDIISGCGTIVVGMTAIPDVTLTILASSWRRNLIPPIPTTLCLKGLLSMGVAVFLLSMPTGNWGGSQFFNYDIWRPKIKQVLTSEVDIVDIDSFC